jgi:hypothetical protein
MHLPIIAWSDFASNLAPVAAGVWRFRSLSRPLRWFLALAVFASACEWSSVAMAFSGIHNLWLIQLYHAVSASAIIALLSTFRTGTAPDLATRTFLALYAAGWLVAKWTFEPIIGDDQYTYTVACAASLISAAWYLNHLARAEHGELVREPRFWIACGVLLYYASNLVLFSEFRQFIMLSSVEAITIWQIHWGVDVVVNGLFTAGFLVARK